MNVREIKRRLKALGITQERLAKKAGVGRPMVNLVLNGKARSERVVTMAEVLIEQRLSAARQVER